MSVLSSNKQWIGDLAVASMTARTHSLWLLEGFDEQTVNLVRQLCLFAAEHGSAAERQTAQTFLAEKSAGDAARLSRAWTSLFGLGRTSITPHESVFRCGLAMQEPRDQTRAFMIKTGVKLEDAGGEPEDHLGIQLDFLGLLLEKSIDGNVLHADQIDLAKSFLAQRLSWVSEFVMTISKNLSFEPDDDRRLLVQLLCLASAFLDRLSELLADIAPAD